MEPARGAIVVGGVIVIVLAVDVELVICCNFQSHKCWLSDFGNHAKQSKYAGIPF
jgi:hypothetical protein